MCADVVVISNNNDKLLQESAIELLEKASSRDVSQSATKAVISIESIMRYSINRGKTLYWHGTFTDRPIMKMSSGTFLRWQACAANRTFEISVCW